MAEFQARRAEDYRIDVQSGADEFHPDEAVVGARQRTRDLEEISPRAPSEGLRTFLHERRAGHGCGGGFGHADARRSETEVVGGDDVGGGNSDEHPAEAVRIAGSMRAYFR